jgi:hypothetical protein
VEWRGEERSGEERSLVQFNTISTIIYFSKLSEVNRSSPAMEATHPGQLGWGEGGRGDACLLLKIPHPRTFAGRCRIPGASAAGEGTWG